MTSTSNASSSTAVVQTNYKEPSVCTLCGARFHLFKRKHHCSICSKTICWECSQNKLSITTATGGEENSKANEVCFTCFLTHRGLTDEERHICIEAMITNKEEYPVLFSSICQLITEDHSLLEPIIIVTNYRLHVIKRDPFIQTSAATAIPVFKESRNFHIFDLVDITFLKHERTSRIVARLTFSDPLSNSGPARFFIATPEIAQLVKALRDSFQRMVPGRQATALLSVSGPQDVLLPLNEVNLTPAFGFVDSYKAQCDYCGVPPSEEVISYIIEQATDENHVLEFDKIPGIEPKNTFTIAFEPIVTTLFNNHWFTSLSLNRVNRKGLAFLICSSVANRSELSGLAIMNQADFSDELLVLGRALCENPGTKLSVINLSGCYLSEVVVKGLSRGIAAMQNGLKGLILANCQMKPRCVSILVKEGLMENYPTSCALQELDLSNNRIGESINHIQEWMQSMGSVSKLEKISIASTDLSFPLFTRGLNRLSNLRALNVSFNTLDISTAELLSTSCQLHKKLSVISASNCRISGAGAASLLGAILSSRAGGIKVSIDLSNNQLDDTAFAQLAEVIKRENVSCLDEINLSGSSTTDKGLKQFLQALMKPGLAIRTFIFNNENLKLGEEGIRGLVDDLVNFAKETPSLTTLSIAGGSSLALVCGVIKGLCTNKTLLELDISKNKIGEIGARFLGQLLYHNSSLLRIVCEDIAVPPHSWATVSHDIKTNTTLQYFTMPWKDYESWCHQLTNKKLDTFRESLIRTQERCALNRAVAISAGKQLWQSNSFSWESTKLPTVVEDCPQVQVPESLQKIAPTTTTTQTTSPRTSTQSTTSTSTTATVSVVNESGKGKEKTPPQRQLQFESPKLTPSAPSTTNTLSIIEQLGSPKGSPPIPPNSPAPSPPTIPNPNQTTNKSEKQPPQQQQQQQQHPPPPPSIPTSPIIPITPGTTFEQVPIISLPEGTRSLSPLRSNSPSPSSSPPIPPPIPDSEIPTPVTKPASSSPPIPPPPPPPPNTNSSSHQQPTNLLSSIRSFKRTSLHTSAIQETTTANSSGNNATTPEKSVRPQSMTEALANALSKRRLAVKPESVQNSLSKSANTTTTTTTSATTNHGSSSWDS